MKKQFIISILTMMAYNAHCQINSNFKTCLFQIENDAIVFSKVDATNANTLYFYSKPTGGKLVGTDNISAYSDLLHSFELNKVPAFVLFDKKSFPIKESEFALKNIDYQFNNGILSIQFNAEARSHSKTSYQIILKNQSSRTVLGTFNNQEDLLQENFGVSYLDNGVNGNQYFIEVHDVDEGLRFSFPVFSISNAQRQRNSNLNQDALSINPTICHTEIIVTCPNNLIGKSYYILDGLGRTLLSGVLNLPNSKIDVSNISSGIYYFTCEGSSPTKTIKFQKD